MSVSEPYRKKVNHVAIIMDGNGRWATKKKVSRRKGHESGVKNCIKICKNLNKLDFKINEISFYVFSTENWKRSVKEVRNLFILIEEFYKSFADTAVQKNIVIRHNGSREKLSKKMLNIIDDIVNKTKNNKGTYVNLLFNYGSRKEIEDAVKKMLKEQRKSFNFRDFLYVPTSKDPDLIIRTGGEMRLSNFMLWQGAYSELYFTKILWPDFKISTLNKILHIYSKRIRSHGK